MAINFVKNDDIRILRDIEQYYSTQIDEMPMNGMSRPVTDLLLSTIGAFISSAGGDVVDADVAAEETNCLVWVLKINNTEKNPTFATLNIK